MPLYYSPVGTERRAPIQPSLANTQQPPTSNNLGLLSATQCAQVIQCLIKSGFGIAAICSMLFMTRENFLDLLTDFGISQPHDNPMRRNGSRKAWTAAQHFLLISGWLSNWRVSYLAEQIDRSQSSIYRKARRLGLPKRDRKHLFAPENQTSWMSALPPEVSSALPRKTTDSCSNDVASAQSNIVPLQSTLPPLVVQRKRGGREVIWTYDVEYNISLRKWSNQSNNDISRETGISVPALRSRSHLLSIPRQPRNTIVSHFDPKLGEQNAENANYEFVPVQIGSSQYFWREKHTRPLSRKLKNRPEYQCAI